MIGIKMKHKNYKEGNEKTDNILYSLKQRLFEYYIIRRSVFTESNICMVIVYIYNSLYTYH